MAAVAPLTMEAQSEILLVIKALSDSWNSHDMATYAAQFAEDADFVNVLGMHWKGRAQIEAAHVQVHRTIFRNSKLKTLNCSLRPLAPGVVLTHVRWEMTGHESPSGVLFAEVRRGVITGVFIEQDGRWPIAAFQNTDIVPMSLPEAKS